MITMWSKPELATTLDTLFWKYWETSSSPNKLEYKSEEKDSKLTVKIALPGVNKEDLEFKIEKSYLTVTYKGESEFVKEFEESFYIGDYDPHSVKSSLVNGVLTIKLEKKDEAKPVIFKLE